MILRFRRFLQRLFKVEKELLEIQEIVGYYFKDISYLRRSRIHSSYSHQHNLRESYERLEFLGDSVLELILREEFFRFFKDKDEGFLSRLKGYYVSKNYLARIIIKYGLDKYVLLGKSEKRKSRDENKSIYADFFESLLGAIYLDGGLEAARKVVKFMFKDLLSDLSHAEADYDYKNRLRSLSHKLKGVSPEYEIYEFNDKGKKFMAKIFIKGEFYGLGRASNKKEATQIAAKEAYYNLKKEDNGKQKV